MSHLFLWNTILTLYPLHILHANLVLDQILYFHLHKFESVNSLQILFLE
eukprot:UN28841